MVSYAHPVETPPDLLPQQAQGHVAVAPHCTLVALVLAICLLLPRPGGGMLLLPVTASAGAALARLDEPAGLDLLGAGPWPGTVLVRPSGALHLMSLLRAGVLPVAVPLSLCGGRRSTASSYSNSVSTRGFHG